MNTKRLLIRKFQPSDWLDLYEYLSQAEVVKYEPYDVFTKEQAKEEAINRSNNTGFWASPSRRIPTYFNRRFLAKSN